jgi:bacterial/archaeal transporter family-2 protein
MEALAVPFLLAVGALLAVQAAANVQLSAAVGSPIAASTLQLAVGAALLLALAVLVGAVEHLDRVPDAPAWHLVGGVGSAIYITAGILLFPRIGAIVTVGLFIAGQMAVSLVLDGFGWLGLPRDDLGATAWVGAAAVVAGAALIVHAQAGPASNSRGRFAGRVGPAWIALALAAGAVLPVQGAINAQLRSDLDAPVATGAFSFLVATAAMLAALAVLGRFASRPRRAPGWRARRGGAGSADCAGPPTSRRSSSSSPRSGPRPPCRSPSPASSSPRSWSTAAASCACPAGRSRHCD